MASMPELGSKISLISKSDIRYEGQLYTVDPNECTIALANGKFFFLLLTLSPLNIKFTTKQSDFFCYRSHHRCRFRYKFVSSVLYEIICITENFSFKLLYEKKKVKVEHKKVYFFLCLSAVSSQKYINCACTYILRYARNCASVYNKKKYIKIHI